MKFALALLTLTPLMAADDVDALIELNHWKRARQIVEARLQLNPKDARAHAWLSKIKYAFGDAPGSLEEAGRAVALDASKAEYHCQLAESSAYMADQSNMLKGMLHVRRMKKEIAAALAINPRHTDTLLVKMMFAWKAPAIAGGDKEAAWRVTDELLLISPLWGNLAKARLWKGQGLDEDVERVLLKAVKADPSFYRARISLAQFYCCSAKVKKLELAERAANDALALDPSVVGAYEVLAQNYAAQQRWADLDRILLRSGQLVPEDLSAYFAAARTLFETHQDAPRAQRYLRLYLSQLPEGRSPSISEARTLLAKLMPPAGNVVTVPGF